MIIKRLAKNIGVVLERSQVECRARCCRLTLDEVMIETYDDLMSAVGLGFEPPEFQSKVRTEKLNVVTKCWSTKPLTAPLPDRAVERETLFAKIVDQLRECGQGVSPAIGLQLWLELGHDGQIVDVESNAKQLGHEAATSCAETAILRAAQFAAAPMSTRVPIRVTLGK
jgi:hypothetical protein